MIASVLDFENISLSLYGGLLFAHAVDGVDLLLLGRVVDVGGSSLQDVLEICLQVMNLREVEFIDGVPGVGYRPANIEISWITCNTRYSFIECSEFAELADVIGDDVDGPLELLAFLSELVVLLFDHLVQAFEICGRLTSDNGSS